MERHHMRVIACFTDSLIKRFFDFVNVDHGQHLTMERADQSANTEGGQSTTSRS